MSEAEIPSKALALIEVIAGAIRAELGEEIDAYAGYATPDRADPMNRAFRAAANALLRHATNAAITSTQFSRALLHVTRRRLAGEGWSDSQSQSLIAHEAGGPDDWLTFLLLSSRAQIAPLLNPGDELA